MSGSTGSALAGEPASAPPYGPHGAPRPAFIPVGREHLGLLRSWFSEPHVREWWGAPDEEVAAVEADLAGGGFAMWIATLAGAPFAYLQDCDAARAEEARYADAPAGWRAVDLLIGSPSHLGRGLAAPTLRAFAAHAAGRGAAGLLLDPDARNGRALRAYRRAGFREVGRRCGAEGEIVVMGLPLPGGAR